MTQTHDAKRVEAAMERAAAVAAQPWYSGPCASLPTQDRHVLADEVARLTKLASEAIGGPVSEFDLLLSCERAAQSELANVRRLLQRILRVHPREPLTTDRNYAQEDLWEEATKAANPGGES